MSTQVLLVDNDARRSYKRRKDLAAAGVEVISAVEEQQAAAALKSDHVDVICIDSQFVANCGPGIGALIERRMGTIPVILIADEARIPGQLQRHVDVIVDREDFPRMGKPADATVKPRPSSIFPAMVLRVGEPAIFSRGGLKRFLHAEEFTRGSN